MAVDVFISYADKDLPYLQKLETHLAALKRQNILQTWHAERIRPGEDWNDALARYLERARVVLLLISADYVFSDESYSQMEKAIRRARQGTACVIPILIRPCYRQGLAMEGLLMLPNHLDPISQWPNEDAAWAIVTEGIYKAIVVLNRGETVSPMSMPPYERPSASMSGPPSGHAHPTARISVAPPAVVSVSIPPHSVPARSVMLTRPPMPAPEPAQSRPFPYQTLAWITTAIAAVMGIFVLAFEYWDNAAAGESSAEVNALIPEPTRAPAAEPASKINTDPLGPLPAPTFSIPLGGFGQPEKSWVEAYGAAIGSGDVERILSLHVLPTPYFFAARDQSEAQLRKRYKGWYDSDGRNRRTGFDSCSLVHVADDGSRACRCITYVDPPFKTSPSRVPTCLVFRNDGKLLARTEIGASSSCPPR